MGPTKDVPPAAPFEYGQDLWRDGGRYGGNRDGVERWWRHVIGGAASARFHRPDWGSDDRSHSPRCKPLRKLESLVKLWDVEPANELLNDREANQAYLAARPGLAYVLYFADGGAVDSTDEGHGATRRALDRP